MLTPCITTIRSRTLPVCKIKGATFIFWDNFGRCGPILIILFAVNSEMNCRTSWNKTFFLPLNLLLHYVAKFGSSTAHLYGSYLIDAKSYIYSKCKCPLLFHMCTQINLQRVFVVCLSASTHVDSCTLYLSVRSFVEALFNVVSLVPNSITATWSTTRFWAEKSFWAGRRPGRSPGLHFFAQTLVAHWVAIMEFGP